MDASLSNFVREYLRVVAATLVPVILVAFMSIPYALGGHPGELRVADAYVHLT